MKYYEPFLYTEDEKFVSDTISKVYVDNLDDDGLNEGDIIAIPNNLTEKEKDRNVEVLRMIDGILAALSLTTPAGSNIGMLIGHTLQLIEPFDSLETGNICRDRRSPKLSRKKLVSLNPVQLARVIQTLIEDDAVWFLGSTGSGEGLFPEEVPA